MEKSFNVEKMQVILSEYKKVFKNEIWPDEDYKWQAVKAFQDNWNIDAANLAEMLEASLKGTYNLLTSARRYAKGMIVEFATLFPDEVRAMFINLFDENIDVYERISSFINKSDELLPRWSAIRNKPEGRMHYQNINAITTYLWLKYPDKYYIFKLTEVKNVADKLGSSYVLKQGAYAENVRSFLKLYDEIREELQKDEEIKAVLNECIRPDCYPDPYLNTLTTDFGFYISRRYHDTSQDHVKIYGESYDSGLTEDDWIGLLNNNQVFTDNALQIVACFKDFGGSATCKQISDKYGRKAGFYNIGSTKLAKRIIAHTGCPSPQNSDGSESFWPVLYTGRLAEKNEPGAFVWELRPELSSALDHVDLSKVILYAESDEENDRDEYEKYNELEFLNEVFMSKEKYSNLVSVLKSKKNIILQGAPGVGKTFAAKRLAYSIMGEKDESRIEFVQFHQNYSYEDFVMGYKPTETGFELQKGIFYKFCSKAANQPDQDFFFIIDEINRGNMSKIFGELLMLIERDYRGAKATLAYNGQSFSVPGNLYIIGMMNTADRSLAMIDYALRRRFSFFEMSPGFETDGFINYQNNIGNDTFDVLIARICDLNKEITADKALGKGFCIGHSYFCNIDDCNEELLESIVKYEIIPMLEEYWFDDETKLKRWSNTLLGIFNEQ